MSYISLPQVRLCIMAGSQRERYSNIPMRIAQPGGLPVYIKKNERSVYWWCVVVFTSEAGCLGPGLRRRRM